MDDIMKIVKALEDSNILLEEITKKKKQKEKGASLLGKMLIGKGAGYGKKNVKRWLWI